MQLALYDDAAYLDRERRITLRQRRQESRRQLGRRGEDAATRLCAACRAHEARYGFRNEHDDPSVDRPRTLCFECFRMEVDRRQLAAAQLARGWNAQQESLPLVDKYDELRRKRGRAQIAARRALAIR